VAPHGDPGFGRAQAAYDSMEPDFVDAEDCDSCGNTGFMCGLHSEPYDDCLCPPMPEDKRTIVRCSNSECDWTEPVEACVTCAGDGLTCKYCIKRGSDCGCNFDDAVDLVPCEDCDK